MVVVFLSPAALIVTCQPPLVHGRHQRVDNMCWLDDVSLIGVQKLGEQVVKLNIDTTTKTCTSNLIDSGYKPWDVSCTRDGNIYVTDISNNLVHIYDKAGVSREWKPRGMTRPRAIAADDSKIYISEHESNLIFVYNTNQEILSQSGVGPGSYKITSIHLTNSQKLVLNAFDNTYEAVVISFLTNPPSTIAGNWLSPNSAVATTPKGTILIGADHIRAYSGRGESLYVVEYEDLYKSFLPYAISLLPRAGRPSILAVADIISSVFILEFTECDKYTTVCT